jgi:hypothetical protein
MTRPEANQVRDRLHDRLLQETGGGIDDWEEPWVSDDGEGAYSVRCSVLDWECDRLMALMQPDGWEFDADTEDVNVWLTVTRWPENTP